MSLVATPDAGIFKRVKNRKKKVALVGSTGSIGTSALAVIKAQAERFEVVALAAGKNASLFDQQIKEFSPQYAFIADSSSRLSLHASNTKILNTESELLQLLASGEIDLVIAAVVGFAGLPSVIAALEGGCIIALANKESLISAGKLVRELVSKHQSALIPVDSEHSALFQCLQGEDPRSVDSLVLTASGGPFRGYTTAQLASVTRDQALKHPTWNMGAKITIDSASMVNKTFELAEAYWLFGIESEKITIVVHPQSIIHSMVNYCDGSSIAQLGVPDMRTPIAYALSYPERRFEKVSPHIDLAQLGMLNFYPLDETVFRAPQLMRAALEQGGVAPAVFTIANDIAVEQFLNESISFDRILGIIEESLEQYGSGDYSSLSDLLSLRDRMYAKHKS